MRRISIFLFILLLSQTSEAYWSTLQTGDILRRDSNRFMVNGQYITTDDNKFNYAGRFDWGLSRSSSFRFLGGSGDVNFGGIEYKWVPFPDYEHQPAVGFVLGGIRGKYENISTNTFRFQPIVSKAYYWDRGLMIPYASIALGVAKPENSKKYYPSQLVFGSEWISDRKSNWSWITEIGIDLNRAFTYGSIGLIYTFRDHRPYHGPYDRRDDHHGQHNDHRKDRRDHDPYDRRDDHHGQHNDHRKDRRDHRDPGPGTYDQRYKDDKPKNDDPDLPY